MEEPFYTLLARARALECEFSRGGRGEQSNYNTLFLCFLPLAVCIRGNGACSLRPVDSYEIFFISISLMTVARWRGSGEGGGGGGREVLQICSRCFDVHRPDTFFQ